VSAALVIEWMKFRRSMVARLATPLLVIAPPAFSLGAVWMARTANLDGPSAERFAIYREGTVTEARMLAAGQILCVVALIAAGFVVSWLFGREYSDHTIGSLYALPVTLRSVATAKITVAALWVVACVTTALGLTVAASVLSIPGGLTTNAWRQVATVAVAANLMGLLGLTFAWVAAATRGYLGAVGSIIGVTAVSQILASIGVGGWVPYVAPAMWAGAGGAEAAHEILAVHLLGSAAFIVLGAFAAVGSFDRPLD